MIEIKEKSKCTGCMSCMNICPKNCITMAFDDEGFWYPKIDVDKCINCDLCKNSCPFVSKKIGCEKPIAYAAYSTDDEIRMNSSSGGIFTEIANFVLQKDGIVYGAAFNDNTELTHISIENEGELYRLRGSKYIQSKINTCYKDAKEKLDDGRLVLFSGTPCQIDGLYSFLKRDYDNLITQDLVCHGVPSPLVWKEYVKFHEKKARSKTTGVFFRNKDNGWKDFEFKLMFENGTIFQKNCFVDSYMKGFLFNLFLRPSCYNCAFKTRNRTSDFTLADFWGIEQELPEMDDNKGTSLVIVNSLKARKIWNDIQSNVVSQETDLEKAIIHNPSVISPSVQHEKREEFFKYFHKMGVDKAIEKCMPQKSIIKRITYKIKRMLAF